MKKTYVLVVTGDKALKDSRIAVRFLKKSSKQEIIIIKSRTSLVVDNIKNMNVHVPENMNNAQASRYLKTNLPSFIGKMSGVYCYIDNDVYAVNEKCDKIFDEHSSPVTFSADYGNTVRTFSRGALKKGDLADEIKKKSDIKVNPDWRIFNGGVFTFDSKSKEFFNSWQKYTSSIFEDSNWNRRDQGALIVGIWKNNLQNQKRLPIEYNWLIRHSGKRGEKLKFYNKKFRSNNEEVYFLHFIHRGSDRYSYPSELVHALNLIEDKIYKKMLNLAKVLLMRVIIFLFNIFLIIDERIGMFSNYFKKRSKLYCKVLNWVKRLVKCKR